MPISYTFTCLWIQMQIGFRVRAISSPWSQLFLSAGLNLTSEEHCIHWIKILDLGQYITTFPLFPGAPAGCPCPIRAFCSPQTCPWSVDDMTEDFCYMLVLFRLIWPWYDSSCPQGTHSRTEWQTQEPISLEIEAFKFFSSLPTSFTAVLNKRTQNLACGHHIWKSSLDYHYD